MKLDFIIIGGQKCGSTYLHHILNEHPEIEMVPGESPQFESPDYENGGLKDLENRINLLDQNKVIGIKRPNYLSISNVPDRIKSVNKNVKLIVIIRNPLERFKSSYFHQMNNGLCPILPLNEGVEKILNGEIKNNYPRTENILEYGFYSKHLAKYRDIFKDKILILTYDQLREDKKSVIKTCYTFLNIDDAFVPEKLLNSRPQKVNYSLLRANVITKANYFRFNYNKDKTRLFEKNQSIFDKFMGNSILGFDKYILQNLVKSEKPKFSNVNRKKLISFYKSDIEELENFLNLDLSLWKN